MVAGVLNMVNFFSKPDERMPESSTYVHPISPSWRLRQGQGQGQEAGTGTGGRDRSRCMVWVALEMSIWALTLLAFDWYLNIQV